MLGSRMLGISGSLSGTPRDPWGFQKANRDSRYMGSPGPLLFLKKGSLIICVP